LALEEINFLRKNSCIYGNLRKIFQIEKKCLKKQISDLSIWQKHVLTAGSSIFCGKFLRIFSKKYISCAKQDFSVWIIKGGSDGYWVD
jgi:hypothetical protein